MTLTDILLIALILFVFLAYPLIRKFLSLMEIYVKNAVHQPRELPGEIETTAKTLLNLKLLAYERIVLFIERMKPDSLIPRTLAGTGTVREYHSYLLAEVRKEYEYNLSQQIYMSNDAWSAVNNLKNNITTLINAASAECQPEQPASQLAQKILEKYIGSDIKIDEVLRLLKEEMRKP